VEHAITEDLTMGYARLA